jgi:hypothetical protein
MSLMSFDVYRERSGPYALETSQNVSGLGRDNLKPYASHKSPRLSFRYIISTFIIPS